MIWRELLAETTATLSAAGVASPEFEAKQMCYEASGHDSADWYEVEPAPVTKKAVAGIDQMLQRRLDGEPLQYVVGRWSFRTLDLMVDQRVLIPRPETEEVAGWGIEVLNQVQDDVSSKRDNTKSSRVLDLGTGSGAIGLAIAAEVPSAQVILSDASEDALAVARANLAGMGVAGGRVEIRHGNWFEVLEPGEKFDLIISNPPYVSTGDELDESVSKWEPESALIASDDGYADLNHIVDRAAEWLSPGGYLVLEMAPWQTGKVAARAASVFAGVEVLADLSGKERSVRAKL